MSEPILVIPRRLAIQILHEAQIAQPNSITGIVIAHNGEPAAFQQGKEIPAGKILWAHCWSHPLAPAVPSAEELTAGGLHLLISLNTKGVLEMRAWQLRGEQPHEREIKIRD